VALFALPLINDFTRNPFFLGDDSNPDAPEDVVKAILETLGFPKR
jgi:hypothetical protein